jgi:hypothetical protein
VLASAAPCQSGNGDPDGPKAEQDAGYDALCLVIGTLTRVRSATPTSRSFAAGVATFSLVGMALAVVIGGIAGARTTATHHRPCCWQRW